MPGTKSINLLDHPSFRLQLHPYDISLVRSDCKGYPLQQAIQSAVALEDQFYYRA